MGPSCNELCLLPKAMSQSHLLMQRHPEQWVKSHRRQSFGSSAWFKQICECGHAAEWRSLFVQNEARGQSTCCVFWHHIKLSHAKSCQPGMCSDMPRREQCQRAASARLSPAPMEIWGVKDLVRARSKEMQPKKPGAQVAAQVGECVVRASCVHRRIMSNPSLLFEIAGICRLECGAALPVPADSFPMEDLALGPSAKDCNDCHAWS